MFVRFDVPPPDDGRRPDDVAYLLLSPPLTDPTTPYHSIPYLVGAARAAGYTDAACIDTNIEALNHLADPALVEALLGDMAALRRDLEGRGTLTNRQQLQYRSALKAVGLTPASVADAIAVLQDPDRFYDHGAYRQATMVVNRWVELLGVTTVPGLVDGFELAVWGSADLSSIDVLRSDAFLDAVEAPFASYLDGPFASELSARPWDVVGISVSYASQLPLALALLRRVRAALPDAVVVLGGTEIADDVKYLRQPTRLWELFDGADLLVVGEGESAFVRILDAARRGEGAAAAGPGILRRDADPARLDVAYEDLDALPAPAYDIWRWKEYWSPEPVLLYSPTRGCYWNRCTFCDYGLNSDRPTSPSRERPLDMVIADLTAMSGIGTAMYLAVDAISPAYLRRLCVALAESPVDLRWSAELRLERSFPKTGMGDVLRRAGCVAVSFGYEAGSQRVLDLIDKGTRIAEIPGVLRELRRGGVGAQMMGFVGFPTETTAEAELTYRFLLDHADLWTVAGIGQFVLTAGSMVARQPQRLGVTTYPPAPGEDIQRAVRWDVGDRPQSRASDAELGALARQVVRFFEDRPFVGGIDAAHTILYFARYGPGLIPTSDGSVGASAVLVEPTSYRTPFTGLAEFASPEAVLAERERTFDAGQATAVDTWLAAARPVARCADGVELTVYPSGDVVRERGRLSAPSTEAFSALKDLLLAGRGAL
jgi:anaerobic magnesium-protoporphyrin IX monomethyl ester cyclase